jgi:hypothetical protein
MKKKVLARRRSRKKKNTLLNTGVAKKLSTPGGEKEEGEKRRGTY